MRQTVWAICRVALAACIAVGSLTALGKSSAAVKSTAASTWYWQNPLPQEEDMGGVVCRTVTACIAVGRNGSIVTTDDGAEHWTQRTSGTNANLSNVTCPDQTICYALGTYPENRQTVILRSVDSGKIWHPRSYVKQYVNELICPKVGTCLVGFLGAFGIPITSPLIRTTDGGRTWHTVNNRLQFAELVVCATRSICYATGALKNGGSANPSVDLVRSADGGTTWKVRGRVPRGGFGAMACPQEDICFATAANCGAECRSEGNVFLTRDGARTWTEVGHNVIGDSLRAIACPSVTTCYAHTERFVVRTTNGGKTWSIRHFPDPTSYAPGADMACPSPSACYVAAVFTVLKTSDGFDHARETLAQSVIHDLSLTVISCPNISSCFAGGRHTTCPGGGGCHDVAAPFAVTSDRGRTWREKSKTPNLFGRLTCPSVSVCYAISPFLCCDTGRGDAAIYRSGDGGTTWHGKTMRQIVAPFSPVQESNVVSSEIRCPTVMTCYVTAGLLKAKSTSYLPILSVLVTQNGGRTWSVRTKIDIAVRAGASRQYSPPRLNAISCPRVMTCFVIASVSSGAVFLSTTDGAKSWRRHSLPSAGRWGPLACPTVTTCAEVLFPPVTMRLPAAQAATVLVTHDAGVSWHRTVFSTHRPLMGIACATSQACRVVGEVSSFGTGDGGRIWQRQLMADGKDLPFEQSIACPAVDMCYAVGGVTIVATHL